MPCGLCSTTVALPQVSRNITLEQDGLLSPGVPNDEGHSDCRLQYLSMHPASSFMPALKLAHGNRHLAMQNNLTASGWVRSTRRVFFANGQARLIVHHI